MCIQIVFEFMCYFQSNQLWIWRNKIHNKNILTVTWNKNWIYLSRHNTTEEKRIENKLLQQKFYTKLSNEFHYKIEKRFKMSKSAKNWKFKEQINTMQYSVHFIWFYIYLK